MSVKLRIEDIVGIARGGRKVRLSGGELSEMAKSRKVVMELVEAHEPVYGMTTGVGEFCHKLIPKEYAKEFQRNIIHSHAAGSGKPFSQEETRACPK